MDIQFSCGNCGQHIAIDEAGAGLTIECPTCAQNVVVPFPAARALPPPLPTRTIVMPREIETNVKQGALIGGWVCFLVAAVLLVASVPTFFLWMPLTLAAFILSIVAMAQRRVAGGLSLLFVTVIGVPILWVYGMQELGKAFSEATNASVHRSAPISNSATENAVTPRQSAPAHSASRDEDSSTQPVGTTAPSSISGTPLPPGITALDAKGGFREYRLGMKKAEVRGELIESGGSDADTDAYDVKNFDHRVGSFQVDRIILEFDHTLGVLKDVTVFLSGKQNLAGLREAFKTAYGEPEMAGILSAVYEWKGADIELNYYYSLSGDSAHASWTSKKVNQAIEDERYRRAKQGGAAAAKGL